MLSTRLIAIGISVPIQQKAQGLCFFVVVADIEHINKRVTITGNARTFKSTSIVITIEEVTQIGRRGKVTQHQTMEELMF